MLKDGIKFVILTRTSCVRACYSPQMQRIVWYSRLTDCHNTQQLMQNLKFASQTAAYTAVIKST